MTVDISASPAGAPPAGDPFAFQELVDLLYVELRKLAHRERFRLGAGATLCTTALVSEAWLKLHKTAAWHKTESGPVGDCPVTDVRRREADVGSFNPWRKSHGRLFGRALSDGLSLAISAVSRTSDGHKSELIALNAPGTFRRLQGFSSCKQIVSAPAVRDWSGQAMFHRIFVHLHTSGSPFAKYGSWLAPAQPHQDQFCESSIGVLIV